MEDERKRIPEKKKMKDAIPLNLNNPRSATMSQITISVSLDPEARYVPLSEKLRAVISPLCPVNFASISPPLVSQIKMVPLVYLETVSKKGALERKTTRTPQQDVRHLDSNGVH
jgi:hypothetical protein